MKLSLYLVTQSQKVSKKHNPSTVVGFVLVYAWEDALTKVAKKYPQLVAPSVHKTERMFIPI